MSGAKFVLTSAEKLLRPEVEKIINNRGSITKRTYAQKEGILHIRYDFEDKTYVTIPLQTLELFLTIKEEK